MNECHRSVCYWENSRAWHIQSRNDTHIYRRLATPCSYTLSVRFGVLCMYLCIFISKKTSACMPVGECVAFTCIRARTVCVGSRLSGNSVYTQSVVLFSLKSCGVRLNECAIETKSFHHQRESERRARDTNNAERRLLYFFFLSFNIIIIRDIHTLGSLFLTTAEFS